MSKKILALTVALFALASMLASCALIPDINDTPTPDPIPNEPIGSSVTDGFDQIVFEDGEDEINDIRSAIFDVLGMIGTVYASDEVKTREIAFGETHHPITLEARSYLAQYIADNEDADAGYIIYSDGKSVAVYWTDAELFKASAISDFIKVCINKNKLVIERGACVLVTFSDAQLERDAYWISIEKNASEEIYKALRDHYDFFDGNTAYQWMANLWDGEHGGFYYSNSARDYEPFLPDLESTYQVLNWLQSYGAIKNTNKAFSNEIKMKLVDFAVNMQASDGYFYHPQWPQGKENLQTDRYGRDLSWASFIIRTYTVDRDGDGVEEKQYPNVCAPSGLKCKAHDGTSDTCALAGAASSYVSSGKVTSTMVSSGVSLAVSTLAQSTVRATAASDPDYSSPAAFTAWLNSYCANLKDKDDSQAHMINALRDEIIARGYCDELLDFLEKLQTEVYDEQTKLGQTPSGLWQRTPDYDFVLSIHKFIVFYNDATYGRQIKHSKDIINSCMSVIMLPADQKYAINDVMNSWTAITQTISNVNSYDKTLAAELRAMVRARFPELIANSNLKIKDFKVADGTFSFSASGYTSSIAYGVPVSNGGNEGCVNAMILASSYYRAVFSSIGYTMVPLCTSDDGIDFINIIETAEDINKNPALSGKEYTFDDTELSSIRGIKMHNNTGMGQLELMSDPDNALNTALHFYSPSASGSTGDSIVVTTDNMNGNCNIAEFDFRWISSSTNASSIQIFLGSSAKLNVAKNGSYLALSLNSGDNEVIIDASNKLAATEWHRIRVEIYDVIDGESAPNIKVFIDGELIKISHKYAGSESGAEYNSNFKEVRFYSMLGATTDILLDNVYITRETKFFNEDNDISDSRG